MTKETVNLQSIKSYNDLYGIKTIHPLVAVVDLRNATKIVNHIQMFYGLYALYLKGGNKCILRYGRQKCDYKDGTIVSFAPGQLVCVDMEEDEKAPNVLGLLFHPDILQGTSLCQKMNKYTFFDYSQQESLHLSEEERDIFVELLNKIKHETEIPNDKFSHNLITINIELLLEYCLRFYERQFNTRHQMNSDFITKFNNELNTYLSNGESRTSGLPTVQMFADRVCLSPGYFCDLIKKETGVPPQEHIHNKIINLSKSMIAQGMRINQIAYNLGFQYPQHFTRFFKNKTGISPKEYRKNFL